MALEQMAGAARVAETAERIDGPRTGHVVAFSAGELRVDYDGNSRGPLVARVTAALDDAALERAARDKAQALLLFERGDPACPVVVALLRSTTPLIDAALAGPLPSAEKAARVDGKRVEIEGRDEVVLRCGPSSLTLRADGSVVLRGVNIVTQADEVQKIRGGKVQVN
jgi:hypothetical protein